MEWLDGELGDLTPDADGGHLLSAQIHGPDGPRGIYHIEGRPGLALSTHVTHGHGVIAATKIARHETVLVVRGELTNRQTPYSIAARDGLHVEPTGYGHFINHACEPSCKVEFAENGRPHLVALRDLAPGDEVSFDYTLTEGRLAGRFTCRCPAKTHKL